MKIRYILLAAASLAFTASAYAGDYNFTSDSPQPSHQNDAYVHGQNNMAMADLSKLSPAAGPNTGSQHIMAGTVKDKKPD